jgi:Peptidase C10 family/Spi protease inhibitor/Secretion system C-terminal sorting domain
MKKQLFVLIICSLLCALHLGAQAVAPETAKTVALHFFNARSAQATPTMRQVSTAQNGAEAAYYIFEPTQGEGFVMVSSQRSLEPVLAYSLKHGFDLEGAPDNLKFWLGNYDQQIKKAAKGRNRTNLDIEEEWTNLMSGRQAELRGAKTAGPLLTTKWGQSPLYNQLCPIGTNGERAKTGCVATAMAQIMKYWRYPLVGQGGIASYEDDDDSDGVSGEFSANISAARYNWDAMPDEIEASNWVPIAKLMSDVGISVEMNYGTDESGAFSSDVVDAMERYFGYNEGQIFPRDLFSDDTWEEMIQLSIDNGIPVYYFGTREDGEGDDHSHAWICDGYNDRFFHMNWGWSGLRQDIWFLLDNLNGKETPYSDDQGAIFGLTPQGCRANYFSTGAAITNVQVAFHIQANSTVPPLPGLSVVFDAGKGVTLLPGFYAPEGSRFTALIEGCGGNYAQGNTEEVSSYTAPQAFELPDTKAAEINGTAKALSIAPNPFSGSTTVTYTLENEQLVSAQLLDLTGRLMAKPISPQAQVAGEHQFTLEANELPNGLYFLVLQTGAKRQTQRVVLAK